MDNSHRTRPDATEYAPFHSGYIALVPEGDVMTVLRMQGTELGRTLAGIPEERAGFRYADGKWSIRELLGHLIDAERIFMYRVLRIARGDTTPLPGFEENDYVRAAGSDARTVADLGDELRVVRESSVRLLDSLSVESWARRGVASGNTVSVRALAYITAGHAQHHLRILHERYGVR